MRGGWGCLGLGGVNGGVLEVLVRVQPCNNLWPLLRCFWHPSCFARRVIEDKRTGEKEGVVGSAELLCGRDISCQPVAAFDWSPDKASVADCQLRAHRTDGLTGMLLH